MLNETDKQELSEKVLQKWYAGPIDVIVTHQNLRIAIDALRATRQELASSEKELEIRNASSKVAHEHIAELEQQLSQAKIEIGGRDLVINSARTGEQRDRERIEELELALESLWNMPPPCHEGSCGPEAGCDDICMDRANTVQLVRAALAKKKEKDA